MDILIVRVIVMAIVYCYKYEIFLPSSQCLPVFSITGIVM